MYHLFRTSSQIRCIVTSLVHFPLTLVELSPTHTYDNPFLSVLFIARIPGLTLLPMRRSLNRFPLPAEFYDLFLLFVISAPPFLTINRSIFPSLPSTRSPWYL